MNIEIERDGYYIILAHSKGDVLERVSIFLEEEPTKDVFETMARELRRKEDIWN